MHRFEATFIDVGWGDSILLEAAEDGQEPVFALIDCNDSANLRSSLIFVKRHFERRGRSFEDIQHNFEFVLLTHGHADHARGLKRMMNTFGTKAFWYPKSVSDGLVPKLLNFARRSRRVDSHQAVNHATILGRFGPVDLEVLWPDHNQINQNNENLNSVVLAATLGEVTLVFTGDAEASLWDTIAPRLPPTTRFFQAPHHGALNGLFDANDTPWLTHIDNSVEVGMSSHIRPHSHPHPRVVDELNARGFTFYRTDEHYHVTVRTDGDSHEVQFSHVS